MTKEMNDNDVRSFQLWSLKPGTLARAKELHLGKLPENLNYPEMRGKRSPEPNLHFWVSMLIFEVVISGKNYRSNGN